ncbi:flagellar hook assembly protein FlgD [Colwellia sp. MEBiC06753]
MEVEAIGQNLTTSAIDASNSTIDQEDFIKLFLAQLNYQDPLEPLNNREFLAQLAQFSSLEQTRLSNDNLNNLLAMTSSNQALSLLGKEVEVSTSSSPFNGTIESINYSSQGSLFTVRSSLGDFISNVSLSQIRVVQN